MTKNKRIAAMAAWTTFGVSAALTHTAATRAADDAPAVNTVTTAVPVPIAVSADAVHFATVTPDNTIVIRDRTAPLSAEPEAALTGQKARILAMTFSLDGQFLATADTDRIVNIWSVKSQKIVHAMHEPKVSRERVGPAAVSNVTGLAFDKTGTRLVIVDNGYGTIGRYEGKDPSKFKYEDAFYTTVPLLSVTSDGKEGWVAGDNGGALHFYDTSLKQVAATTSKMASGVRTIAMSPDGKYLATGGDDNEVKVWNFDGAPKTSGDFTMATHFSVGAPVTSLAFRGDWQTILYADNHAKLSEWAYVVPINDAANASTGLIAAVPTLPVVPTIPATTPSAAVTPTGAPSTVTPVAATTASPTPGSVIPVIPAASPDANANSSVTVTETPLPNALPTPREVPPHQETGTYSADDKLAPSPRHFQLYVRQVSKLVGHSDYVNDVAFSPDGLTLASASRDHTVRLWNISEGIQEAILGKHTDYVSAVAWSPNGRTLASGGWDGRIKLFDVASESENATDQRLPKQGSYVLSLDFSPDGFGLVSGGNDRTARLFNRETGASHASLLLPDSVASIAYSPDGTRIAGGCLDGTIYLWDASMKRLHTFRPTKVAHPIYCIAFIDNDTIAAGGKAGQLKVWDTKKDTMTTLQAGSKDIFGLAYDVPRRILAAGGADHQIRFWFADTLRNAKNGASLPALLTLTGHSSTVRTLAFSSTGDMLASGGWDYNIFLWRITDNPKQSAEIQSKGRIPGTSGIMVIDGLDNGTGTVSSALLPEKK